MKISQSKHADHVAEICRTFLDTYKTLQDASPKNMYRQNRKDALIAATDLCIAYNIPLLYIKVILGLTKLKRERQLEAKLRKEQKMIYDTSKIENITVGGIDYSDYPDFSDAFIEAADYEGIEMTSEEIDYFTRQHPDFVAEKIHEITTEMFTDYEPAEDGR